MLVALAAACLVVAVVAVVAAWRLQRRAEELGAQLAAVRGDLARVELEAAEAGERTLAVTRERDDALERAQRARRDAAEVLWSLVLGRVEHSWRTSIALHAEEPSPLAGADDLLHAAVGIVVDAAREEAGADIDVEWSGDGQSVPAHRAVLALAMVEAIVSSLAKSAGRTVVRVDASSAGVAIDVERDGEAVPVPAVPDAVAVGAGRYRVS